MTQSDDRRQARYRGNGPEGVGGGLDVMVREDGFAMVPDLVTAAVAAKARVALTEAAATLARSGRKTWRNPKGACQVAWASRLVPGLAESPIRAAARAVAVEVMGGRVVERFDYALVTPPRGPGARWHRDQESFTPPREERRVHVWVALQDVDESNGCLRYVPRGSDQARPEEMAVAFPTPAGSALIHDEQTLHGSGPNGTDEPRWAWVLQFAAVGTVRETLFSLDRARASLLLGPARRRLADARSAAAISAAKP